MGKLVRDRVPEIIRKDGRRAVTRTLDEESYVAALLDKVVEEATELRAATTAQRLEEAADLLEVLSALLTYDGFTWADVLRTAREKRMARGGFEARVWLE